MSAIDHMNQVFCANVYDEASGIASDGFPHHQRDLFMEQGLLFLPERDYVTFGYLTSSVCLLSSVTFVHTSEPVEIFGTVFVPFRNQRFWCILRT